MVFKPGQRWTSELEPELGLGIIAALEGRTVVVRFPAADTVRRYAIASAPLHRARFHPGDRIADRGGQSLVVESVADHAGILAYHGGGRSLDERQLEDRIGFRAPEERLQSGRVGASAAFDLRREVLALQHLSRSSPARGFVGGRIDLIPHQLYIAREVARRYAPRVLLADEVGLGKTIEACLILHHLLVTGRVERVLVLVPETLLHQWLVELRRRFNLRLSLYDEERCAAIEAERPGDNPFLDDQLILASVQLLAAHPERARQAAAAAWDILVVDEAHHLRWEPGRASPEYAAVERVAAATPGLLLLTATPEQLGLEGHYARLRLLDPDRYPDLAEYLAEAASYAEVARIADRLSAGVPLADDDIARLRALFADDSAEFAARLQAAAAADAGARERLIADLLDQHGTGRVMFRNTRATMRDLPAREAHLEALAMGDAFDIRESLAAELSPEGEAEPALDDADPRLAWLVALLERLGDAKLLLICRSQETAIAIQAALEKRVRVKCALFHEELTLVQRDRNAAWFADPGGARLLLCSEIGSEGRNFQFVHHLALFDLPLDPDLLEQRIGRLDRIGQTETIHVHVPWVRDTALEVLAAWHHRGLAGFEHCLRGGHHLLGQFGERVRSLATRYHGRPEELRELESLVADSRQAREDLERRLLASRDHLLELSSFRADEAEDLVCEIRAIESDPALPELSLRLFEHLGVYASESGPRTYRLNEEGLATPDFPDLERGDVVITFDRQRAIAREDLHLLTADHPLLLRAVEVLLASEAGTSAFVLCEDSPDPLALEMIFLLECVAPPVLHADRFLATVPIRLVVNHEGRDRTQHYPSPRPTNVRLADRPGDIIASQPRLGRELLPAMIASGRTLGEERARELRAEALERARLTLGVELDRLRALARVNRNIRPAEIAIAESHLSELAQHLGAARLRLDALRLMVGTSTPQ